jgi:hypothetical protein
MMILILSTILKSSAILKFILAIQDHHCLNKNKQRIEENKEREMVQQQQQQQRSLASQLMVAKSDYDPRIHSPNGK